MTAYDTLVEKYGEEQARQIMKDRAKSRKDYSTNYFAKLKAEGREEELRALQAKGNKTKLEAKNNG